MAETTEEHSIHHFDDHDEDEGVNPDIRRMSESAWATLDSVSSEIALLDKDDENNQNNSSRDVNEDKNDGSSSSLRRSSVHRRPSIKEERRSSLGDGPTKQGRTMTPSLRRREPTLSSLLMTQQSSASSSAGANPSVTSPPPPCHQNDDDHDDDASDDGSIDSIQKELGALRSVTLQITRELDAQDMRSMQDALTRIEASPQNTRLKKWLTTSADKQIIERVLREEMKKNQKSSKLERFLHQHHLYGPGVGDTGGALNVTLLSVAIVIWAIVVGLCLKVWTERDLENVG